MGPTLFTGGYSKVRIGYNLKTNKFICIKELYPLEWYSSNKEGQKLPSRRFVKLKNILKETRLQHQAIYYHQTIPMILLNRNKKNRVVIL